MVKSVYIVTVLSIVSINTNGQVENRTFEVDQGLRCQCCAAGTYLKEYCRPYGAPTKCEPCPPNTFSNKTNNAHGCAQCSRCKITQCTEQECTSTTDTVCACPPGQYWKSYGGKEGICQEANTKRTSNKSEYVDTTTIPTSTENASEPGKDVNTGSVWILRSVLFVICGVGVVCGGVILILYLLVFRRNKHSSII